MPYVKCDNSNEQYYTVALFLFVTYLRYKEFKCS